MPRFPNISKYWVSCRSGALPSSKEYTMLTPSIGFCWMPSTETGWGSPAASITVGAMSMT
jgi:hypothetical protein